MVSVVTSLLSQTLWRVVGNDPHCLGLGGRRAPRVHKPVIHSGLQRHAFACTTDHVSEAGERCEAAEPGAWVLLDPLSPAEIPASPAPSAPSLVELCASTYQGETDQEECRRQAPISDQPATCPAQGRADAPSPGVAAQESQETLLDISEDRCCYWPENDGPVSLAREDCPFGVTQHDRGVVVTGSAAAAGSGAGNGRAGLGRQRQCIQSHHVEQPSRTPCRHCPSLHAVHAMETPYHSHTPLTAAAQPTFDSVHGSPVTTVTTYKEDIRDFDIYQITRTGEEGQYPRLPALPTQSDSDTDDGLAGTHKTLRRRKRRNPDSRVTGSKRLHREEQQAEHSMSVEPNATTLLSSALHQGTTTMLPATPTHPSLPLPCASPATQGHCRVSDGRSEGVVNDECDDDDDDETSTVVPEDFANDTDSDIEVLVQSVCGRDWNAAEAFPLERAGG